MLLHVLTATSSMKRDVTPTVLTKSFQLVFPDALERVTCAPAGLVIVAVNAPVIEDLGV
jgi:hypothetical protein